MINQKLYTTLDQSRIVAPILQRLGVEPDGWHSIYCSSTTGKEIEFHFTTNEETLRDEYPDLIVPAYRLDKLLLVLPEWCFSACFWSNGEGQFGFGQEKGSPSFDWDNGCHKRIKALVNEFTFKQGQEAIAACVELLQLLDKEKLL